MGKERYSPRLALVLAALSVLTMGGVVAGFSAILPLLYNLRVGSGFCTDEASVSYKALDGKRYSGRSDTVHTSQLPPFAPGNRSLTFIDSSPPQLSLTTPICETQFLKLNLVLTASLFTADGIMLFYGGVCLK
jgi:hypothetical protein